MSTRLIRKRDETPLSEEDGEKLANTLDKDLVAVFPGRRRRWLRKIKSELLREDAAPEGFHVKGESILYDGRGDEIARWVKTSADQEKQLDALRSEIRALVRPFAKSMRAVKAPGSVDRDLLVAYPMGDPHLGMMAWADEAGEKFDLVIAERQLVTAVDRLVAAAPPAETAILINLGDFFHADDSKSRTPRSGAVLDVSARWGEVARVGLRTMKRLIESALSRHRRVIVINQPGNHDPHTAAFLAVALSEAYASNRRVEVDSSPAAFRYHRFGSVLLGVTHGDKTKPEQLGPIMATDKPKDWGETTKRYWYTGHVHKDGVTEVPGCKVESFRTLAPRDAWASGEGYRSGRDMKCIALHRERGEVERHTVEAGAL